MPFIAGAVLAAWPTTKAVVATWVVFVFADAVGAAGVPVNVGEASGDLRAKSEVRLVTCD
jgi:hypothetical protein